eukprot:TRINITY_DN113651_c0_g1_i1.p1 TRINITY_DN113651_c0_g1~~TRINITY_DN113651_c0_g1_i1.p1  ORF type:complete len:126 (+),score=24.66 TRINITY_DN113651_c0_g1_i1:74-451(+)
MSDAWVMPGTKSGAKPGLPEERCLGRCMEPLRQIKRRGSLPSDTLERALERCIGAQPDEARAAPDEACLERCRGRCLVSDTCLERSLVRPGAMPGAKFVAVKDGVRGRALSHGRAAADEQRRYAS